MGRFSGIVPPSSAIVFRKLRNIISNFLLTGLYSEIRLTESDYLLAGVTIHYNQVAGVTGELDVSDFALGTFSEGYHFADVNKMICFDKTACCASFFCSLYALFKVSPFRIFQSNLQFPGIPEFGSVVVKIFDRLMLEASFIFRNPRIKKDAFLHLDRETRPPPLALIKHTPLCITIVWNIRLRGRSTLFLDPNHTDIS